MVLEVFNTRKFLPQYEGSNLCDPGPVEIQNAEVYVALNNIFTFVNCKELQTARKYLEV